MFLILAVCLVVIIAGLYLDSKMKTDAFVAPVVVSFFAIAIFAGTSVISYISHASDLGTLRGQENVIKVYQEKINRLDQRLSSFNFPQTGEITLNADNPVSSIVTALAEAETALAEAEEVRADALVDIEKRKAGPWSFVVLWMGDK